MTGHGLGAIKEATGRILGRVSYQIEYQPDQPDGEVRGRFIFLDRGGAMQGSCFLELEDEHLLHIRITSNLCGPTQQGDFLAVHFFRKCSGEAV